MAPSTLSRSAGGLCRRVASIAAIGDERTTAGRRCLDCRARGQNRPHSRSAEAWTEAQGRSFSEL